MSAEPVEIAQPRAAYAPAREADLADALAAARADEARVLAQAEPLAGKLGTQRARAAEARARARALVLASAEYLMKHHPHQLPVDVAALAACGAELSRAQARAQSAADAMPRANGVNDARELGAQLTLRRRELDAAQARREDLLVAAALPIATAGQLGGFDREAHRTMLDLAAQAEARAVALEGELAAHAPAAEEARARVAKALEALEAHRGAQHPAERAAVQAAGESELAAIVAAGKARAEQARAEADAAAAEGAFASGSVAWGFVVAARERFEQSQVLASGAEAALAAARERATAAGRALTRARFEAAAARASLPAYREALERDLAHVARLDAELSAVVAHARALARHRDAAAAEARQLAFELREDCGPELSPLPPQEGADHRIAAQRVRAQECPQ